MPRNDVDGNESSQDKDGSLAKDLRKAAAVPWNVAWILEGMFNLASQVDGFTASPSAPLGLG